MRFVSTVRAGIFCAQLSSVQQTARRRQPGGADTTMTTPAPSPTSSPSPAPAPPGTFTIACGTSPIDLGWSGVDTRSCTVTSTNGFDGDVALSCSGVEAASCEFDPATVRAAPDRPANSTMKLTYGEGMSFGIFERRCAARGDGRVRDRQDQGERPTGRQQPDSALSKRVRRGRDRQPRPSSIFDTTRRPGSSCAWRRRVQGSLTYFRATVYKGLTMMRRHHIQRAASLDVRVTVAVVHELRAQAYVFSNQNTGSCCGSDRMISFPTMQRRGTSGAGHLYPPHGSDRFHVTRNPRGAACHRAPSSLRRGQRHEHRFYGGNRGSCIITARLMADYAPPGFTTAQQRKGMLAVAVVFAIRDFATTDV